MPFFITEMFYNRSQKRFSFLLLVFVIVFTAEINAQTQDTKKEQAADSLYREDQFYLGITYNLLNKIPDEIAQTGFSSGFHFGFIRDFPINEKRNIALGLGIGYSANSINQNLLIEETETGEVSYSIASSGSFTKNKFSVHQFEIPFEFRWRSSTATDYKFWRIYAGFKLGYVIFNSVKFTGEPKDFKLKGVADFNDFQYGLTLSAGYDKFNIHLYYPLNTVFRDTATLDGEQLDMSIVKLGLMLYIL